MTWRKRLSLWMLQTIYMLKVTWRTGDTSWACGRHEACETCLFWKPGSITNPPCWWILHLVLNILDSFNVSGLCSNRRTQSRCKEWVPTKNIVPVVCRGNGCNWTTGEREIVQLSYQTNVIGWYRFDNGNVESLKQKKRCKSFNTNRNMTNKFSFDNKGKKGKLLSLVKAEG